MSAILTTVTTSTGGISATYDYSAYLERIATSLETIASVSTTTGVRITGPFDWLKTTEVYSWYNQNLDVLRPNASTVDRLVSDINTITNQMPKFL